MTNDGSEASLNLARRVGTASAGAGTPWSQATHGPMARHNTGSKRRTEQLSQRFP